MKTETKSGRVSDPPFRHQRTGRRPALLLARWWHTVNLHPTAPALHDAIAGRTWSRAELAALGTAWAEEHGAAAAGQRVIFAEANGPEWWRVFLGLLASDAVLVPLDPGEPPAAQESLARAIGANFAWREGWLQALGPRRRARSPRPRLLKLTSGTTGVPRALPFTDEQLLADGRQVCATMGITGEDVNLACIPLGHSYGLGNLVLPLLAQGTALVFGAPLLPQALADTIADWKPTVFPAVPALLRALADADIGPEKLHSLRTVISAGAPLPPEVAAAFARRFSRKIHNFYGSSETGGIAYDRSGDAALTGGSVGRPLQGVRVRFAGRGRFWVESPAVGGRGRYRPADRGELNAKGELVLLGRAGRMLKIAGRRLDPAEVERVLRQLPGVADAHVAAHAQRTDALAALVAGRRTVPEVRAWLQARLAGWKIPKKILVVAQFPLTARGKPDTRQLRALLQG